MKPASIVWVLLAVALCGVVTFAVLVRRTAVEPAPPVTDDEFPVVETESAGIAVEKTSELLSAPVGDLGSHACVERSGRAMNTSELLGSFVVADFIFTQCAGTCPAMTTEMGKLQAAIRSMDDVRLVSFSVDPETDTPEVLSAYAKNYGADTGRWLFVRCEKPVIADIAFDRVKLVKSKDDLIMHSSKFALLDREGQVRAYYSPLDDAKWLDMLLADLAVLRREKAR